MNFIELLLFLIALVALVVVAILSAQAASILGKISSRDGNLGSAYTYCILASVITWIGLLLIVFGFAFALSRPSGGVGIVRIIAIITLALIVVATVFLFIALAKINRAGSGFSEIIKSTNLKGIVTSGAVIGLVVSVLILVAFIVDLFSKGNSKGNSSKSVMMPTSRSSTDSFRMSGIPSDFFTSNTL